MTTTATRIQDSSRSVSRVAQMRRITSRVAGVLVALVLALAGLAAVPSQADASVVLGQVNCGGGQVVGTMRIFAEQRVAGNGQYVRVMYAASDAWGHSKTTAWSGNIWAPAPGAGASSLTMGTINAPGWGRTRMYGLVAYWTGRQWVYDSQWRDLGTCQPNKGIY